MIELVILVDARGPNRRNAVVHIEDVALASFSATERHALIDAMARRETLGTEPLDPPIDEATVESVRAIVRARVTRSGTGEEKSRLLEDEAGRAALASFIESYGTENQNARQRESLLPPREALTALRQWLFGDLDRQFVRFEVLKPEAVCSWKRVRCAKCPGRVEFENRPCESPIVAQQYYELERLRLAVPVDARVSLREHIGTCTGCSCRARRVSARVMRRWKDFEVLREYQLSGAPAESTSEAR